MINLNTKDYWDDRFDTNWLEYSGDSQTEFFANLLCDLIPQHIKNEIFENGYTVCDMGCALGEGTQIFSRELRVPVDGADFSETAVSKASEAFKDNKFFICDIKNIPTSVKYDVIICSNVLEHFLLPWNIFKNFTKSATKYIIMMVPYKEQLSIDEHMYKFSEDNIPVQLGGFSLEYTRTVDGRTMENSFYPDQQIFLIYKKADSSSCTLQEISQGVIESYSREYIKKDKEYSDKLAEMDNAVSELNEQVVNSETEHENYKSISDIEYASLLIKKDEEISALKANQDKEIQSIQVKLQRKMSDACNQKDKEIQDLKKELERTESKIAEAIGYCNHLNTSKTYKWCCLLFRFIQQYAKGNSESKKEFKSMIWKRIHKNPDGMITRDDAYNFVLNIRRILSNDSTIDKQSSFCGSILPISLSSKIWDIIRKPYCKADIIILSVISYDFRFQRPQQFAKRFAENGHRVFYVNADFNRKDYVGRISENLYSVDFFADNCNAIYFSDEKPDFDEWIKTKINGLIYQYAISDAVVIVDYPNWVECALELRQEHGFRIITDYMDDYTGFMTTTTSGLKDKCERLLKESDAVVPSSNFLYEIACKYNDNLTIVRNGTETDHFAVADVENSNERPVIGYYGAISEWFDWEKICYIAQKKPEWDIVLVGAITHNREEFEKYNNIKLLGERDYSILPEELAKFDVCLIPFDTSTDLIKATNPVKFYEYLSAGKKIVATEIPELMPFRDEYVYMSNDDATFLKYVEKCVDGVDELADKNKAKLFAAENDWQHRYEAFYELVERIYPKVSIIVITYNNLELNKACIKSIFENTAYPNYEVIVIDNASTDGTVDYLEELDKKEYSNLKIILSEQNLGFAGGNNKAIESADGDYIVLLNNDTVVTRGWLTKWVNHFYSDENAGMIGAVTNSIGNEAMIAVNYKNSDELKSFSYQYTMLHLKETYNDVDRIALFATMIDKKVIDEKGALDTNYKVGMFEDDDYAMVVNEARKDFYIAEDVFVHHVNNASFKKLESEEYKKIFEGNKEYYEKKWNVKWKMPKYREGVSVNINIDAKI